MGFKIGTIHIVGIVVAVVVMGVLYVALSGASSPVVETGDTISVYYTGKLTNGTVFDTNVGKEPLNFTVGSGELIKGFDQGVVGMKLNENKTITIPANEAYGPVNPALIMQVPRSAFGNQSVQKGMVVTQNSNGQEAQGTVTAVNSTNVTVDFNPPLAGQTLIFTIKVVSISKK